jgi:hypothetical protein
MRFSWTGLILAPLLVPVIFSTTMATLVASGDTLMGFVIMLVASCAVSYGATIFLFLPCLFVLSLDRQMTGFRVCLLGLVLGALAFVPLTFIAWAKIDPTSAPPISFLVFLRWAASPITALFPLAGLIMAGLYWWLGKPRASPSAPMR